MSPIAKKMVQGGVGPIASFTLLLGLPLSGRFFLSDVEYAVWAVLNSVLTVALTIDFGGTNYVTATLSGSREPWQVIKNSCQVSLLGSICVGLLSIPAWYFYINAHPNPMWSFSTGGAAVFLAAMAGFLRSCIVILSNAAMVMGINRIRNGLLVGQAVLTSIVVLGFLVFTKSAWAVVIGWTFSSTISLIVGVLLIHRFGVRKGLHVNSESPPPSVPKSGTLKKWATTRMVVAVLRSFLIQGDKWIVGILGGPAILSAYELAWRLTTAPRLISSNLTSYLIAESSRLKNARAIEKMSELVYKGFRFNFLAAALGGVGSLVLLASILFVHYDPNILLFGLILAAVAAVDGATSAATTIYLGIGKVGSDIPYLTSVVCFAVFGWVVAYSDGRVIIGIVSASIAMIVGSVFYIVKAPGRIKDAMEKGI